MAKINIKYIQDTRREKKDGSYPIVISVRWNNKTRRIATPYSCKINNWDSKKQLYNSKEPNYQRKNIHLKEIFYKIERFMIDILEGQEKVSDNKFFSNISYIVKGTDIADKSYFVEYIEEFASTKTRKTTKEVYEYTKRKIEQFDAKCTFETMDRSWLARFENWMKERGMKTNAYAIHLRNIRAVFNYCIDEEYTTLYPFRKFKIKKEETRKRSLTVEQLRILRDYPCEDYQVRYRDMFMLMFYLIGINSVDLFNAKHSDVVNGRLEYKRAKTGKLYSVLIQPEAMKIIEKYKGKDYLLNVMDEYKNYKDFLHRMGIALKEIGPMERKGLGGKKIRKPLFPEISSYWSRHTWATIAASLDIPKEVISAGLGHDIGSSVTSIYIDFNMKKVDDANRIVIDYVNEKK